MPATKEFADGKLQFPKQITLQADIELEAAISAALIDEFNRREQDFMNFRVLLDLPFFPNIHNIVILNDVTGERDPIFTQCKGFYDPDAENLAAGEVPLVRLSRNIEPVPDDVMDRLIAADPRVLEASQDQGTSIIDVTDNRGGGVMDSGSGSPML